MSATISIILDARRIKQVNKKFPVKLRVTHHRKSIYYQTIFDLTPDEWSKLSTARINNDLQIIRNNLKEIEQDVLAYLKDNDGVNFNEFEKNFIRGNSFFRERTNKPEIKQEDVEEFDYKLFRKKFPILLEESAAIGTLTHSYLLYIKKLLREGRIGTASNYHCSYASLKKFRGNITFQQITVSFLKEFENWLKDRNVSKTTIGIYLRPLRSIFNEAIEQRIIIRDKCYPFGRRKYIIPAARKVKKALELSDMQKL